MNSPIPPAYSIPKSNHLIFDNKVPGPGEYSVDSKVRASAQSYSFSKSPRKIHDFYSVPGPGVYEPKLGPAFSGYSLGKSPRILSNYRTFSPGPGEYSYAIQEKRYQYSISKAKNRNFNLTDSPGPGYYNPSLSYSKENSPQTQFSRQPRMPNSNRFTPSPGQYEVPSSRTQGFTIPKASPRAIHTISPGPGVYEIPTTIGLAVKHKLTNN
jgi:hypothetical protein